MLVHFRIGPRAVLLMEAAASGPMVDDAQRRFALDQSGSLSCGKEDANLTDVQQLLRPDMTRTATYPTLEALRRSHKWLNAPSYT